MPGEGNPTFTVGRMSAHIIGYASVSTNEQDLTAQRNLLAFLGLLDGGHHRRNRRTLQGRPARGVQNGAPNIG